jgi:hypothetical protein
VALRGIQGVGGSRASPPCAASGVPPRHPGGVHHILRLATVPDQIEMRQSLRPSPLKRSLGSQLSLNTSPHPRSSPAPHDCSALQRSAANQPRAKALGAIPSRRSVLKERRISHNLLSHDSPAESTRSSPAPKFPPLRLREPPVVPAPQSTIHLPLPELAPPPCPLGSPWLNCITDRNKNAVAPVPRNDGVSLLFLLSILRALRALRSSLTNWPSAPQWLAPRGRRHRHRIRRRRGRRHLRLTVRHPRSHPPRRLQRHVRLQPLMDQRTQQPHIPQPLPGQLA